MYVVIIHLKHKTLTLAWQIKNLFNLDNTVKVIDVVIHYHKAAAQDHTILVKLRKVHFKHSPWEVE